MNFEPTAEVIRNIAEIFRDGANRLDRHAESLVKEESFDYASMALNEIGNIMLNARTDLLVTRPIREFERERFLKQNEPN